MKSAKNPPVKDQGRRFVEAARELGCEQDEAKFNAALGKVARHKPVPDKAKPEKEPDAPR